MINESKNNHNRAGRYVRQPAGYRAFIPAPLPPDPPVDVADPLRVWAIVEGDLPRLKGAIAAFLPPLEQLGRR